MRDNLKARNWRVQRLEGADFKLLSLALAAAVAFAVYSVTCAIPYQQQIRLANAPFQLYTVLRSDVWSQSSWGQNCTGTGRTLLCNLNQIWTNCSQGIYLDIGSNVGVQLRKLYNPEQFPGAPVLPLFKKTFGTNHSGVCALGIEPNPAHTPYLETLNTYFKRKGYQAVVLTEIAASVRTGTAAFFQDHGSPVEWGASLTKGAWQRNTTGTVNVHVIDLPLFIINVVRPIVAQNAKSTGQHSPVLMKLDVEGEEYSLLPGLMLTGALCDINSMYMEAHPESMRNKDGVNMSVVEMWNVFEKMRKANPRSVINMANMDDETYLQGHSIPFPV